MTRLVFADVETYYSREYSLRRMTPAEYVLDPRFECIGWSVAIDDQPPQWKAEHEFRAFLKTLPEKVAFVSHNALFDMFVLAHRFNYIPKLMIDTLGMARATIYGETGSVSLAKCAEFLALYEKKGDTVLKVEGMTKQMIISSGLYDEYIQYGLTDTRLCRLIFHVLMGRGFPMSELLIMDEIIRACVCPQLQLNQDLLYTHLAFTEAAKQGLLDRAGLNSRDLLMSNDRFAEALRRLGVDPPMKLSPTPGKAPIYAFAKTDEGMQELAEHPDPEVQALVAARIGNKTTLEETRTQRFIDLSKLTYPGNHKWLPVPLKFSGAHTHRLSGDWKINLQNLTRGGLLRKSLVAPKGKVVVVADCSQIEARLVAWFCLQHDLVQQFADGVDVYCDFAGEIYHRPITKADKVERFLGKTSILGLGYGMGGTKFDLTARSQAKVQKLTIEMDLILASHIVDLYRRRYPRIPEMWRTLNNFIPQMARGVRDCTLYPGCPVRFEGNTIVGPNGLKLYYHNLSNKDGDWWFNYGKLHKKLFGGKMLENIIQFLARIIIMDAAIRIRKDTNRHFALQVHDELAYVVDEAEAEDFLSYLIGQLCVRPEWGLDIPLAAEGGIAENYGDAK